MEMTQIRIDLDVYKAIQQRLKSFNDNPNQVLRRIFELKVADESPSTPQGEGLYVKGVFLKNGLKMRKRFKGRTLEATVEGNSILYDGRRFNSPSGAAVYATGTSINGWRFWEYLDDNSGMWRSLSVLRGR
ncbi:MAG: DUF2924 domain-containing protein [Methanosarcinaceae archaeon]|jgi:hypothetical protein|nr:DUF2924 domain-containing protein [Methanosarcinaceae archaeon]